MIKIVVVEKTGLLKDMKINKDQFQILAEEETLKFLSKKQDSKHQMILNMLVHGSLKRSV